MGFLSGCENSSVRADILHSPTVLLSEKTTLRMPEISQMVEKERVYGAIITEKGLERALSAIEEKERYQTVVLLAATTHATDARQVFTYEYSGVLEGVRLDHETISRLKDANIAQSLGSVGPESFWNRPSVRLLQQSFPDARFVLISVNRHLSNPEALGYALKSHLPEESIVLAFADFTQNPHPLINEFHQSFATEIIGTLDEGRFKDLPAKDTAHLQAFGRYLRLRGGVEPQLFSDHQAVFREGESPDKTTAVHMVAFGDMMLGRYVRVLMEVNGLEYPFTQMDNDYLRVNDLLIGNLEGPITSRAIRHADGMNFGFFPNTAPLLKKYHFDLLSQANNHTLDKTSAGYEESMQLLRDQGMIPFGHQRDITEQSVAKIHVRGHKLAFFGLEEVNSPMNDEKVMETMRELIAAGYKVIMYPHWGIEYRHTPNKRQRDLAHAWIDAGAFAVIGHHPHVIQTYETYNGRPIFYSLGNAIFDQYWSVPTQEGLSIALIFDDNSITIYFLPVKIDRSRMRLMNEYEARIQLEKLVQWGSHTEEEKQAILSGRLIL